MLLLLPLSVTVPVPLPVVVTVRLPLPVIGPPIIKFRPVAGASISLVVTVDEVPAPG